MPLESLSGSKGQENAAGNYLGTVAAVGDFGGAFVLGADLVSQDGFRPDKRADSRDVGVPDCTTAGGSVPSDEEIPEIVVLKACRG